MPQISCAVFGGVNANDQADALIGRAFITDAQGNFVQQYPLEVPYAYNVDFVERAIGKRQGSALYDTLASVMVSGEIIIRRTEWTLPGTTTRVRIAVGKKSIYTDQSGSWAQINNSSSSAYTHASQTVTKCSFVEVDNHLLILLDGSNHIQVYKSGADLDDYLLSGKTWENSYGGGTNTITGTWDTGTYMGFELHGRLVFFDGTNRVRYTPTADTGIWDLASGSFRVLKGNIVAGCAFTPKGGNELNSIAFFSTTAGPQYLTGFDDTDQAKPFSGGTALSYRSLVVIDNWVVYMTTTGGFEGVNVASPAIDLGRRLKTLDGSTGPLDTFVSTNSAHANYTFGYYDRVKKQAIWYYPDASNTTNSNAVAIDFYLGEPSPAEIVSGGGGQPFEKHVRCLPWKIKTPDVYPWFVDVSSELGANIGVLATGICYTINSGKNDLDTVPIESAGDILPDFDAGASDRVKSWGRFAPTFKERGNWNTTLTKYIDRQLQPAGSMDSIAQIKSSTVLWGGSTWGGAVWAGAGITRATKILDLVGRFLRLRNENDNADEDWVLLNYVQEFRMGSRQD